MFNKPSKSISMHFKVLTLLASAAALSGCMTPPVAAPVVNADGPLLERLAASAERASMSMQRLSQIRASKANLQLVDPRVPAGLEKTIAMNWVGPIEGLASKVAEVSGYAYEAPLGPKPMAPVIVSVSTTNQSMFNILMDAGGQAGSAADIVIHPEARKITVKFPPTVRSGGYVVPTMEKVEKSGGAR